MDLDFRIGHYPPYVFNLVAKLKKQMIDSGQSVIDLAMGNPDSATPDFIIQKLILEANQPQNHRYTDPKGLIELRQALSDWYQEHFKVHLDPEYEVITTLGSKEGLAHLTLAMTNPGDVILAPEPAYPIHQFGFKIAGANVLTYQIENEALMLKNIFETCKKERPKAIVLSFPSNPCATMVSYDFFEEVVKVAKKFESWVIHDFAYADIYFTKAPPPSILQVPGAKELAVETYSMSKSYNMPGWRIGFVAGNKTLVSVLSQLKSYYDYGLFAPLQKAAVKALQDGATTCAELRDLYRTRRDYLIDGLEKMGWHADKPDATMFAWTKIPKPYQHMDSLSFVKMVLQEAKVVLSPGIGFGKAGDQYVRWAFIENPHVLQQALTRIEASLFPCVQKKVHYEQ